MNNAHFFNKEDAERHSKRYGGIVHDNTHNNNAWVGNNYTVSNNNYLKKNTSYDVEEYRYNDHVTISRDKHEDWMSRKGWSESVKEMHRNEFERCDRNKFGEINMWFNENGSFTYEY